MLADLFQKLNLNIKYSMIKVENLTSSNNLNILNRTVYIYLVLTLYKLINLIYSTDETSLTLPNDLSEIIFLILNDICLIDSFKSINMVFSTILINLDRTLYDIYMLSNEICDSMKCACDFLLKYDQMNYKSELVKMAKKSLNYMDYHVCVELAGKIIEFCSKVVYLDKEQEVSKADIEYLVTSCMISKCEKIRIEAYATISKIVNDAIHVQVATEINSKRYKKIDFLLLNKVFYQFVTFGLFDKCNQVKKYCESILSRLLQCELLVPESFRLKLTQLIVIYMPFIQCFASQVDPLGQCILGMSSDLLTPSSSSHTKVSEESLKLFLGPAIERLRSSLRYLYSKDKTIRKKGFQQSIGFLTKYSYQQQREMDNQTNEDQDLMSNPNNSLFNLNDFYLRFLPDKFCDMYVQLKRKNRTFLSNNYLTSTNQQAMNIFQTDNLLRIYNIFTSDTVDIDVKQNAGEQLAIMLSTGDQRLYKAFINLDGVNYCIRFLKSSLIKNKQQPHLFLSGVEREALSKSQAACISCLSNIFYWSKEIRQLYLFDLEFYRMILKCTFVSYNVQLKAQNDPQSSNLTPNELIIFSNAQEDLSIILFMILYHQVSCLDYYHSNESHHSIQNKFDISSNLKDSLIVPFNISNSNMINTSNDINSKQQPEMKSLESQQLKAYDINYKLNGLLKQKLDSFNQEKALSLHDMTAQNFSLDAKLKQILDKKFRLYWNFKWHGGSLLKLGNDLFFNEQFVQDQTNSK
jgi:hypothetical protein